MVTHSDKGDFDAVAMEQPSLKRLRVMAKGLSDMTAAGTPNAVVRYEETLDGCKLNFPDGSTQIFSLEVETED